MCVHLVCMWCAWCVPRWCMARHGEAQLGKLCKTRTQRSKHVKQVQSRVNPKIGTHLSPNQLKNVTWAFYQAHGMQHYTTHVGNAWTYENMPKYKIKLTQGANTDTNKSNRAKPNQDFVKSLPKTNKPNPFFRKSQIQDKPRIFLHNLKKRVKRLLRNIPLKRFYRDLNLKLMGFEWKSIWVRERFEWGKGRELKSVLKLYHISPIKMKTCIFRGLDTREITRGKHI